MRKIALISILMITFLCACSGGGGGGGGGEEDQTYYLLGVNLNNGDPSAKLALPEEFGSSIFKRHGLKMRSALEFITMSVTDVAVTGTRADVTIRITNTGAVTLQRVWLITKVKSGGEADETTADGFIGDGVYYFLRNLDPDEVVDVHVFYNGNSDDSRLSVVLDVVTVADRIGFQYFIPNDASEPWTINTNGGDAFSTADLPSDEVAAVPTFSPDGGWTAFAWTVGDDREIGLARTDGGGTYQLTCYGSPALSAAGDFTRDGKKIFIRHSPATLDWYNIYLLDIKTAMEDCSSASALTPLTASSVEVSDEMLPTMAPDGSFIVYGKLMTQTVKPPYPEGDPNPTACADWVFGSEMTYSGASLFLLPTDPDTGLATGPETKLWSEDALFYGTPAVTPDSQGVLIKAGGCSRYQHYCNAGSWLGSIKCVSWLTTGLYRLNVPSDWSSLPYNYADNTDKYTNYPGFITSGDTAPDSPYWCWQSDRVVFSNSAHHVSDCDPLDCANDRRLLFDEDGLQYGTKCTPAVIDP